MYVKSSFLYEKDSCFWIPDISTSSEFRNDGEPNIAIIWDAGFVSLAGFAG
jgi:hypothetical protein